MTIRVGHLYPEYLNIYADRGNIAVLTRRAAWRGHELEVERSEWATRSCRAPTISCTSAAGRTASRRSSRGTSRGRARRFGTPWRAAAVLAVCGGYQLLGHFYRDRSGAELPGAGCCRSIPWPATGG